LDADFTGIQKDGIIRAAIGTDNYAILEEVVEALADGNFNHVLQEADDMLIDGPVYIEYSSILYNAIERGCHAIAVALVNDPEVNTDQSGSIYTSRYMRGGFFGSSGYHDRNTRALPNCLEMAESRGMTDVVQALKWRELAKVERQAGALKAELGPGPTPD